MFLLSQFLGVIPNLISCIVRLAIDNLLLASKHYTALIKYITPVYRHVFPFKTGQPAGRGDGCHYPSIQFGIGTFLPVSDIRFRAILRLMLVAKSRKPFIFDKM